MQTMKPFPQPGRKLRQQLRKAKLQRLQEGTVPTVQSVAPATVQQLRGLLFRSGPVVPWTCREEWLVVYEQVAPVLSQADDPAELAKFDLKGFSAIIKSCWKPSWPEMDDCMECTVVVLKGLRALYADDALEQREMEDDARLTVSMAVIRFVKSITEDIRTAVRRSSSITAICQELGVPEWLVRVRHEASHGDLKEHDELRDALVFAAKWLKEHYWDVEKQRIDSAGYMQRRAEDEIDEPTAEEVQHVVELEVLDLQRHINFAVDHNRRIHRALQRGIVQAAKTGLYRFLTRINPLTISLMQDMDFLLQRYLPVVARVLVSAVLCPEQSPWTLMNAETELPSREEVKGSLLVHQVLKHPGGTQALLLSLADVIHDPSDQRARLVAAWTKYVLKQTPRNRKGYLRLWDPFDWNRIVRSFVARPSPYAEEILKMLSPWVSKKKEAKFLTECRQLTTAIARDIPSVATVKRKRTPRTLEMLKKEMKEKHSMDMDRTHGSVPGSSSAVIRCWEKATDVDWTGVPIGMLPWQNGFGVNLYQELLINDYGTEVMSE
ncbi:uncharacterized protein LOC129593262 isoform X2 [Paramacrobiotus metropolitanus]|uniref:uncharacterized protein LOC129593262 isoform X2 n=1 Tax=Paramacrobiotus metropolitanus TaxID=2943436 RepID=UPI00244636F1|nr:uncharacterized protein LOC129593262 isoform X2 [Paramacrobiotus metropolitanus]